MIYDWCFTICLINTVNCFCICINQIFYLVWVWYWLPNGAGNGNGMVWMEPVIWSDGMVMGSANGYSASLTFAR